MNTYLMKFSSLFHQDILSIHTRFEDAVADVLVSFNGKDRMKLAEDIDKILQDPSTSAVGAWRKTGSSFSFGSEADARSFMMQVYELI